MTRQFDLPNWPRRLGLAVLFCSGAAGAWAQSFGVNIVSPTNNQFFSRPLADVPIAASVTNTPGVVARVEFFGGAQLVGMATNEPYSAIWTNAPSGTNVIRAVAYAEGGASVISPDVTIHVNHPPTVAITAPGDQGLIGLGSNLVMVAAAADPEGAVAVVYFYLGDEMVGSLENPPYQWAVSNLVMGDYVLTAVAEDNWGVRGTSGPVRVSVIVPDAGIMEDFERGPSVGEWREFAGPLGTDVLATNYGGAVSGTNALWFGGDDERYAATRPLALRAGATVEFWLRISGGNGGNWNLAELPDEGVLLEYSNDGEEWKTLTVFDTPAYTNWQRVSLGLPLAAVGTNTVLRWRQPLHSGEGYSHWALDDVLVMSGPTKPVLLQSPQTQSVTEGDTVVFSALARGSEPLSYQWRANGVNLLGATSPMLTFSNVTLNMSGWNIAVVVSNDFGSISTNATLTVRSKAARIAVYDHPSIVDTAGGMGAESDTVQAGLSNLNNVVVGTFTNLQTAGLTNDLLWFPEFEGGDLAAVMTAADRQAISTFVGNGGLLVIHGSSAWPTRCQNFLNQVFGFSVQVSQIGTLAHARTAAAAVTAFATATNSLQSLDGSDAIVTSSLPTGSLSIYEASGQSLVTIMPVGKGKVIFLGWDWYNARPIGSQDAGWLTVMACAVLELAPTGALPPGILSQPSGQKVLLDGTATFSVGAYGSLPLSFQWQLNSTNLPGATNASLVLSNVTLSQAGSYRVVVTNAFGSVTSSNALLEIIEFAPDIFQITALGTDNAQVVDHDSLTGDDRNSIAASATRVFYSGDSSTARFRLEDLGDRAALGRIYDGMVSDLRTEQLYTLANGSTPITGAGTITSLLELDGDTGTLTGNQINLSTPITTVSGSGIFAGYGQVVIHNGTRVYTILLPSGTVADLGAMTMPTHRTSEGWAFWGVAEYFGGRLYLAYVRDSQTIVRARVPDATTTTISTFTGLSDMACFTVVPALDRWYFHYEGGGQFGGIYETLGYASATFNYTPAPIPPSITVPPVDRVTVIGGSAVFTVSIYASRPFAYQWQWEGTNLPGATNSSLSLSNVSFSDAGNYRVVVTNGFGAVTSAVAKLSVVDVGAGMFDDFEPGIDLVQWAGFSGILGSTVLATNYGGSTSPGNALSFNNSGSRFAVTRALNTTAGGTITFNLRLANGSASTWETVDLPAKGIVLEYSTNGTNWIEMGRYDTTNFYAWTRISMDIPAAAQGPAVQFRWRQLSNLGTSYDHWALDDVLVVTGPTPPAIARQPRNVTGLVGATALFAVEVNGSKLLSYQWQFGELDLPGATNATLLLSNLATNQAGNYRVVVTNAFGAVTSVVAALTVVEAADVLYDDFEPGIDLAQWASFGGVVGSTILATNFGGSVSPSNSLWFSYGSTRFAATRVLNTSAGGVIGFYLCLGFGASPWETVDLPVKGVVLEYSTNGTIWVEMGRYATPDFYAWTQVVTNIPAAARGAQTQFRWRQLSNSGSASDQWALDEVWIALPPTPPGIFAQPAAQAAAIGGTALLAVEANGSKPLRYQWQFNGEDLPGATNTLLWLDHLATNQAGEYRAVVDNANGAVTSVVASLSVLDAGSGFFDDFEPGVDLPQWAGFGGTLGSTVLATNYGGFISPSNSLWFSVSGSRFAATRPLNTTAGGAISFFLRLGSSNSTPWELVDLPSYGIVLEYATNGTDWIEMGRYNTTNFYAWRQVTTNIPVAARAAAVQFRWRQLNNSGSTYYDHWALDDVLIALAPMPPGLYAQPQNYMSSISGTAFFSVSANGSWPFSYQWRFNGEDLPGATNVMLWLDHLTTNQAGGYQVVVTNANGAVTSAVATLTVLDVGAGFFDDFEPGIDLAQWSSFGGVVGSTVLATNYGGYISPSNSLYFSYAGSRFAATRAVSTAAGGVISFYLRMAYGAYGATPPWETVDLPAKGIVLEFATNGTNWTEMGRYDTTNFYAWTKVTTNIPAAAQGAAVQFRWRQLSNSGSTYYDQWVLDDVMIATGPTPPAIFAQPMDMAVVEGFTASFTVGVGGSVPLFYQWRHESVDIPDATNATLVLTNVKTADAGTYSVVVTNVYGGITSSNVSLTLLSGGVVGYFTDGNTGSTGPSGPILRAGMVPVKITDIATFNLSTITCLFLDESSSLTTALQNRLGAIQSWVNAGGLLIIHDRSVSTSFLLGTTGVVATYSSSSDIGIIPPSDTLVTQGPFGVVGNTTLDGGSSSTHGYVTQSSLPPGARPILCYAANTTQVVSFCYPLGSGFIYYSAIPLDYYLDGNGSDPFRFNATNTYTPNVLIYMQSLSSIAQPPKIFTPPANAAVAPGGTTNLGVQVIGSQPLSYQWRFNGLDVAGATDRFMTISNMSRELSGYYSVVVTNAYGAVTSSAAQVRLDLGTVTVRVPVFGITNTWKYNQTAANLGTTWRQTNYSDASWPSGRGLLAFENNSAITPYINTTLSLSNGSTRVITYYFRSWVTVPEYPANLGVTLVSSNLTDDGAVFYLNGIEQGRYLMTGGTVSYNTYSLTDAPENVYQVTRFTNSAPWLGTSNLLAVEVHQNNATSSDVVFGMAMFADVIYPYDPPYINSTPVEIVVNQGQPFSVSVSASSVLPMTYQWWLNGNRLGFTQPAINVAIAQPFQSGVYQVVVSNLAGMVTSVVARVTVVSPPAIAQGPLTQELEVGSPLMLQVICTGGALNYQWRQGGLALTGMTNAQLVISNATVAHAGVYDVAVWNAMGAVTSIVAEVTFRGAYVPPPSFVLDNRALQLRFNAPAGVVYQVEASENFRQWVPLGVVTNVTGTVEFLDYGAGKRCFRFYRLRAGP